MLVQKTVSAEWFQNNLEWKNNINYKMAKLKII